VYVDPLRGADAAAADDDAAERGAVN
jgi:hypothetical protein